MSGIAASASVGLEPGRLGLGRGDQGGDRLAVLQDAERRRWPPCGPRATRPSGAARTFGRGRRVADLAERLGGGGADLRRRGWRAWRRSRPTAAFALNLPSEATSRAWRSAFSPGSRSRSIEGLDRRRRCRSSRRSPAPPRGPSRAPRRRGAAAIRSGRACLVVHRAEGRGHRDAGPRSSASTPNRSRSLAKASRSLRLPDGGDGREADRGVGVGQGRRGSRRGRSASPPTSTDFAGGLPCDGRVPHHWPSQGFGLAVGLREGEEGLRPLVGGSDAVGRHRA